MLFVHLAIVLPKAISTKRNLITYYFPDYFFCRPLEFSHSNFILFFSLSLAFNLQYAFIHLVFVVSSSKVNLSQLTCLFEHILRVLHVKDISIYCRLLSQNKIGSMEADLRVATVLPNVFFFFLSFHSFLFDSVNSVCY